MDEVQKPSDSECYTSSSDPFRIHFRLKQYAESRQVAGSSPDKENNSFQFT
jgi:hypothetical protein